MRVPFNSSAVGRSHGDSPFRIRLVLQSFVLFVAVMYTPLARAQNETFDSRESAPEVVSGSIADDAEAPNDELALEAQLVTRLMSTRTAGDDFTEFLIDRAELGAMYRYGQWGAELRLETIRSSSPGSVMGIDGDSLLLRLKRGWGFGRFQLTPNHIVEVRAGLIPDAYKELLENDYDLRGLAPTMTERARFFDTADIGAMVGWDGWEQRVRLRVELSNGEGRNQVERNNGKNTTIAFTVTPLALRVHHGPLHVSIHGAWRDGSLGVGNARNHRLAAGITFVSPCPRAGFEFVRASGYDGRAEQVAQGWAVWANSYFATHWIGGAFRYDSVVPDVNVTNDAVRSRGTRRITAALYSDLFGTVTSEQRTRPPLGLGFSLMRVYAAVEWDRFDEFAGVLPGSGSTANTTRYLLVIQANGHRSWQ